MTLILNPSMYILDALQPQQSHTVPVVNNNPWATLDPLEGAFLQNPASSFTQNGSDVDVGYFNVGTSSAQVTMASSTSSGDVCTTVTTSTAPTATPTRKRTPADFLGDHKDLVDLEKLVDRNPGELRWPFSSLRPCVISN